ncbi:PF05957 family protein [Burkholderia cenocepacia BC7]|nr:PF05957 family protein [Burkholderia cenocepacia BC7]
MQSRLDEARSALDYASGSAAARLRDSAERVSQAVHDNPWQTAGVVAGLAFVAGLLLSRR